MVATLVINVWGMIQRIFRETEGGEVEKSGMKKSRV